MVILLLHAFLIAFIRVQSSLTLLLKYIQVYLLVNSFPGAMVQPDMVQHLWQHP